MLTECDHLIINFGDFPIKFSGLDGGHGLITRVLSYRSKIFQRKEFKLINQNLLNNNKKINDVNLVPFNRWNLFHKKN